MLKIEKLHIHGFKSFADPTEIVLGDGITAIVGPNGCGKSNVSDGISWVLGEQSAKSLRGGKMEDVIFNGTRDRKPMGMAEVIMTLVAVEDIAPVTSVDDVEIPDEVDITIPGEEDEIAAAGETPAVAEAGEGGSPSAPSDEPSAATKAPPMRKPARRRVHHRLPTAGTDLVLAAGERVTVGRRLYRSGESEYIMNGRACRLRDIHDLFMGTGLGGANYAIIEQGRIGQILSSKPQDRRALIEEAAGITKFKARKRAAELRLDSARQNLHRLNDIVVEVERSINTLKRQAGKARRYNKLKDEMRGLLRDVYAADWERVESELERLDKLSKRARDEQEALARGLSEREADHRTLVHRAREAEEELAEARGRVAALEREAQSARDRHLFQREQLADFMLRREEIERERARIAERLELIAAERERKGEEHKQVSAETDAEAARVAKQESFYQTQLHALGERERALESIRNELVAEVGRTERLRNQEQQYADVERRLDADAARLEREAGQATARRDEAERHLAELAEEVHMSQQKLDELRRAIVDRVEALSSARAHADDVAKRLSELQERRSSRGHRLASLEDLDARHAYYAAAVQQILGSEQPSFKFLGTLADVAEVEPEYEAALESLFGRELQSILVPGFDDALAGVEHLVASEAGRAAFLVVGAGGGEERASERSSSASVLEPGPHDALSLLRLPAEIARAVASAYPEKARALVVASLDDALERSRQTVGAPRIFVTLAGEQVVNGRVLVGGPASTTGAHLLGLKREIKELKAELEQIVYDAGNAEAELAEARHAVAALETESGELDSTLRADEKTAIERSMRQSQLETDFQRAEQHIRVVDAERKRLAEERAELDARREATSRELAAATAEREAVETRQREAQRALAELRSVCDAEGQVLAEARAAAAARQERRRAIAGELRRLGDEEQDLTSRRDRSAVEGGEVEARIEQLTAGLGESEGQTEQYSAERAEMDAALGAATAALTAARERVDALEEELSIERARLDAVRAKVSELEVERARLLSDATHIRRGAQTELMQEIEEVVRDAHGARESAPTAPDEDEVDEQEDGEPPEGSILDEEIALPSDPVEAARARLDQIRRILDSMGNVNHAAVEELAEAEERFVFLTTQRRDVLDSIEATDRALSEIKRRSRQRFREAFEGINRNFGELFVELFGGGRGEMVMLDEEDVLESGIDIVAQPPGKRLQNVLLLSGGEKAMTAIALVLAIFKYKPSPFCILDEVDAPLDEVNVGRFSDHVVDMSATTQFLVITHNKRTMEAARALYGVTMEEPGISKLVSVRFAEEAHDGEAGGASSDEAEIEEVTVDS